MSSLVYNHSSLQGEEEIPLSLANNYLHRNAFVQTWKPNPAMQLRYCWIVVWQSPAGSADLENSMHSSRLDFSSLQTQHGCYRRIVSKAKLANSSVYRCIGIDKPVKRKEQNKRMKERKKRTFGLDAASAFAAAGLGTSGLEVRDAVKSCLLATG